MQMVSNVKASKENTFCQLRTIYFLYENNNTDMLLQKLSNKIRKIQMFLIQNEKETFKTLKMPMCNVLLKQV